MFKQYHYTLMIDGLSNVWNVLSVMKLTNVLFLHSPLPGLSKLSTARYLTCLDSLKPRNGFLEIWAIKFGTTFHMKNYPYKSSGFLISYRYSLSRSAAHYHKGGAGPFGPIQDVFRACQGLSGLLDTGQLQGRWSGSIWLS